MKAILVIDDDPLVRSAVVDSLRNAGFDAVSTAMDMGLLEALAKAPQLLGLILIDARPRARLLPIFSRP